MDLLAELRNEADSIFRHPDIDGLIVRAADEIERLRGLAYGPTGQTYKAHCVDLHARMLRTEATAACANQQLTQEEK